jgi:Family of unknown function (DUF6065)/2OG-Fe(II) oxygenase superfamily
MKLQCYALHDFAPRLIAAPAQRQWMDEFVDRHAYRCLPLSIANAHGWEALCPAKIEVEWNGGSTVGDLSVRALKALPGGQPIEHFCRSNFSRGIVTFHLDYIFRTDAGWDLLATGPLNHPKENAYPLTGIIETDWLPYPFTMNWQIMKPGRVVFEEGEPFCFLFPVKKQALLDCEPEILRLSDNAELTRQHDTFRLSRDEFMKRFHAGDDATIKQAWQRHYFLGRHPDGALVDGHINKLRLKEPVDCRKGPVTMGALTRVAPAELDAAIKRTDSRWEDRSPLNAIERDQSDHNEAGRRRIDRAGHLVNWNNTYIVRSNSDAFGHDFLVVDDLLTAEQCDTLCRAFWDLVDRTHKSDEIDPFWNNRFIWFADVKVTRPAAGEIMIDALQRAIELVKRFYLLRAPVYPDLLQIVKWDAGIFMLPHADNANPDATKHMMPYRDLAGIVYLNDDYEGGELYFTAHDIAIKPRRGMFVGFTAGFHHEHAVLRVDSGTRLTMPFFLAFDSEKADRTLLQHATA